MAGTFPVLLPVVLVCGGVPQIRSVGSFSFGSLRRSMYAMVCNPHARMVLPDLHGTFRKTDPHRRRLSGLRRQGRVIHPPCLSLPSNPGFFMILFSSRAGPPGSDLFFGVISIFVESCYFVFFFHSNLFFRLFSNPYNPQNIAHNVYYA